MRSLLPAHRTAPFLALLLVSCSVPLRGTDVDPPVDLSRWTTYEWLGAMGSEAPDEALDAQVHAAIDKALQALGLERATAGEADLGVAYRISVEKEIRNNDPQLFMYAAEEWEIGTLTLELLEGTERVWRGSARDELRRTRVTVGSIDPQLRPTREQRRWRVDKKVGAILRTLD